MPLPPVRVHYPHVGLSMDGSPILYGTRVPVRRIFDLHKKGVAFEAILRRYATLSPAAILSALAFGYDNSELIAADIERERRLIG